MGIIPYLGDIAKLGKLPKLLEIVGKTVDAAKQSPAFAKVVTPMLSKLKGASSKIRGERLSRFFIGKREFKWKTRI